MSEGITIDIITALVSIGASVGATWLQSKKWREAEQPASAAGTADIITGTSLELVAALRAEMKADKDRQTEELSAVRMELSAVRIENKQMRDKLTELEDVKEWAERLVHQVRSLGVEPVKMRMRVQRTVE